MSEVTAIVPIREQSQRLPRKNFRDFNEKPLYHWILSTLESVDEINRIVMNTNSEELLSGGLDDYDVEISERPEEFYGDSTTRNIIQYEVDRIDTDVYLQTFCTNPLLEATTITTAISKFLRSDCDSLFTVSEHQARMYTEDLVPVNHDPYDRVPTQELSPVLEDNSNIYLFTEEVMERMNDRMGEEFMTHSIGKIESIDIDTQSDFDMAEYFHKQRQK